MDVLQERILMIGHTGGISWDMQLLHDLFSTGNQIKNVLLTETIMFVLINIILVSIDRRQAHSRFITTSEIY